MDQDRKAAAPPSSTSPDKGGVAPQPGLSGQYPKNKRRIWLRRTVMALGLCLLLCVTALVGTLAALRNESVQAWVTDKINAAMEATPADGAAPDIRARITHLSGPLPFGFALGVELYDAQGLWLRLPACSATWNWQALPGALHIAFVRVDNAELLRLPQLSQKAAPPPSPPLTEGALRTALADALRELGSLPSWLPQVRIDELSLNNALLPQSLLGQAIQTQTGADGEPQTEAAAPTPADAPQKADMPAQARLDAGLKIAVGKDGAQARLRLALKAEGDAPLLLAGMPASVVESSMQASVASSRQGESLAVDASVELVCSLQMAAEAPAPATAPEPAAAPMLAALLGQGGSADVRVTARITAPAGGGPAAGGRAAIEKISVQAGPLRVGGHATWESGTETSWLAGPLDVDILTSLGPQVEDGAAAPGANPAASTSPAPAGVGENLLPSSAKLRVALSGPLDAPDTRIALDCPAWNVGRHALANMALKLESTPLRWRQVFFGSPGQAAADTGPATDAIPEAELAVNVQATARVDTFAQRLGATIFARQGRDAGSTALLAGVRDLQCDVLGVAASGQVTAVLPMPLVAGGMPRADGKIDVRVADWKALSAIVPGARLDGDAALSLELRSQQAEATAAPGHTQQASLRWRVPRLSYREGSAPPVEVQGLEGEAALADIFGTGQLAARLDLGGLRSGDKRLGARVRAQGSVYGPLEANLETSGFAAARCAVRWQPGTVEVRRLDLDLPAQKLGLRAAAGASLRYGSSELGQTDLGLSGLDITMKPSGRLRAQASLSAEKFDVRLTLEQLELAPWRVLVPALPAGTVAATARLAGSPAHPQGDLRVDVRGLSLPGSALKPMNLTLTGKLERDTAAGGALALRLVPDQATVVALGGTECRVEARLPLLFGADGLPRPHMQGPLRAAVRWNGAVAPLWSLLPVADQRLAGRLALALDVGGTLETPVPKGFVRMDDARYENLTLGVLLSAINLRLDLEEGHAGALGLARLNLAAADGQGGTARITGQGRLDGSQLDFKASLDHLRPLRRRDVRVELSAQASVAGSATAPEVRGTLTVNQGLVLLNNLEVGGSITTLPISEASPAWARTGYEPPTSAARQGKKAASSAPALAGAAPVSGGKPGLLDLRIVIPGRFVVEGFGLKSEWRADMHIGGTPAEPLVSGQLNATKGSLDILGKNFKLARGAVTFAGGDVSNPLLDIMLTSQTPALMANISIVGTVRKMQLILSSDPEMPRDEILAQILFGKSASELGRLENLRLAAAVAQLAGFGTGSGGGGVLDSARQALGVDVLRFNSSGAGQQGQSGENMAAGSSVEMGKYLTEDIYVGVQQGAKQGSTAFVIQLELTPRANLEVRTEQQSTKGGVTWKYNY
ncbi:MAG: translocation/assembly module TamB [Desulfovibrio sp.]|uniref:translocation/assembly module TamB domain-containing protein n=1 Tax=Desulfovibrio sp. TaxID=885 RepID=UPI00135E6CC9|nr:translocation/assembly module TamB domain-containing protein [Desulfovibrio sp.]MTJ91385.1 translocation/assembly module TamB [Desulfovibrio sp.]